MTPSIEYVFSKTSSLAARENGSGEGEKGGGEEDFTHGSSGS